MAILLLLPLVTKEKNAMKNVRIQLRCTVYEKKLIKVKAKRYGLSMSEYCRRAALNAKIRERLTEEQLEAYRTLVRYNRNFVLIGNMFRKRNPGLVQKVLEVAELIKGHLQSFGK